MSGKTPRSAYKPRPYGTLAAATLALIDAAGGHTAAATKCSASDTTLQRYSDPDLPERSMPANIIVELEDKVGEPLLSRWLVERLGCTVLPAIAGGGPADLTQDVAELAETASALFADFAGALSDKASPGTIDEAEMRRLLEDFDRVVRAGTYARVRLADALAQLAARGAS